MKSPQDIAKAICSIVGNDDLLKSIQASLEKELKGFLLRCNNCSAYIENNDEDSIHITKRWGYFSTNKDDIVDSWNLCPECSHKLITGLPTICSICRKSMREVAATLKSMDSGTIYYGDYDKALREHQHDGEYLKVNNKNICELCYDHIIDNFTVPVTTHDLSAPFDEMEIKNSEQRTLSSLKPSTKNLGIGDTEVYKAVLSYADAIEVANSDPKNKNKLISSATVFIENKDFNHKKSRIDIYMADSNLYTIPLPYFTKYFTKYAPDFLDCRKPSIIDCGQTLCLGEYQIDAEFIVDNIKGK